MISLIVVAAAVVAAVFMQVHWLVQTHKSHTGFFFLFFYVSRNALPSFCYASQASEISLTHTHTGYFRVNDSPV